MNHGARDMQGAGIAHVHLQLGAAWVTEVPTFPIVVPPLSREDVIAQIGGRSLPRLGTEAELDELFDELHDRIREHLVPRLPTFALSGGWERSSS